MHYQQITDTIWTKWPNHPELSLYDLDGECAMRSQSRDFDLTDSACIHFDGEAQVFLFGIRQREKSHKIWTEKRLRAQESNIRHDLAHDGFEAWLERVKGPGLPCYEEAL